MNSNFVEMVNYFPVQNRINENRRQTIELAMIPRNEPYINSDDIMTITDLDGVFFEFGKNNTSEKREERFKTLGEIAKKSQEIIILSGRIITEKSDYFPFISRKKIGFLKKIVEESNPNCNIDFQCGLEKITGGFDISERAITKIEDGGPVAVIGSSFIDRNIGNKICNSISQRQNLFYFDTGHLIV